MAHAAGLDANANMARGWIEQRLFSKFQFAGAHGMNRAIGRRAWHNLPSSLVRMANAMLRFRSLTTEELLVSSPQIARRSCDVKERGARGIVISEHRLSV